MRYLLFAPVFFLIHFITPGSLNRISNSVKKDTIPHDILYSDRDTTIDPATDFFMYANGGWIKNNPIPGDQSYWGIGQAVQEELYTRLRNITTQSLKAQSGVEKKVGDLWYSAMDTLSIEKEGLRPLQPELNAINAIKNTSDLLNVVADFHVKGINSLFREGIAQDRKNSEVMAYYLFQGGIGLPNRDYYFNNDSRTQKIRNEYASYVAKLFRLLGKDSLSAQNMSEAHIKLETELAKASRKLEDLRNPYKNYNKMTVAQLTTLTPAVNWPLFLTKTNIKKVDSVIVGQPEFYKALQTALTQTSIETWKNYLRFHLLNTTAPYLSSPFVDAQFQFYGSTLRGAEKMRPRWKRMLDLEDRLLGEALGKAFVKEYFPEAAKQRYSNMVEEIRTSLHDRILKLDWMSDSTKQKALYKLAAMKKKVGYPDKWKDFSTMQISRQSLVRNVINANKWWYNYEANKLGKAVDRTEWNMTPQTYNAYYSPSNNEIVLPAGIFTVPGFRDFELDDALVYGYAGATTIGHEITHGFDDQGRQYDAKGNLHNWWTAKDSIEFTKRAQMMIDQFSGYTVVDSMRINGKATLGENIADLGGALLGLDAFKKTETYKSGKMINGMTPLQRYFLGYALGWLGHERKEALANQVLTDVHSPAKYRVNGPFVNVDEFYSAYPVKQGNTMYRPDSLRVKIW